MPNQTAVEWLQECLSSHLTHEQQMQFEGLFQQSKAMEQQQSMDFARLCLNKAKDLDIRTAYINTEQYYNSTYKNNS
jgi:hypothetical protein